MNPSVFRDLDPPLSEFSCTVVHRRILRGRFAERLFAYLSRQLVARLNRINEVPLYSAGYFLQSLLVSGISRDYSRVYPRSS